MEMMVAVAIFSLAVAGAGSLFMFGLKSLASLANYSYLNKENRTAMDKLTREIRQARQVTGYTTNSITILNGDGHAVTYTFQPSARQMLRTANDGSGTQVLLENCSLLSFQLFQRNPISGTYDVYPVAAGNWQQTVKVIQLTWKTSRTLNGTPVVNSEDIQTARIVIRKQQN